MLGKHRWHHVVSLVDILHVEGALAHRAHSPSKQFPNKDVPPQTKVEHNVNPQALVQVLGLGDSAWEAVEDEASLLSLNELGLNHTVN